MFIQNRIALHRISIIQIMLSVCFCFWFDISLLCFSIYVFFFFTFSWFLHSVAHWSDNVKKNNICFVMVTVLCQRAKKFIFVLLKSQNLLPIAMAWRSIGTDNADLINQLEGTCIFYIITKYRANCWGFRSVQNETKRMLCRNHIAGIQSRTWTCAINFFYDCEFLVCFFVSM